MQCKNCGAELATGDVICRLCGEEIQIVPDFNIYEDEMFQTVREEEQKEKEERIKKRQRFIIEQRRRKKKKLIIIAILIAMVAIILGIVIGVVLSSKGKNANSYEYQLLSANESYSSGNYEDALKYLKNALALDGNSLDARFLMSEVYLSMGEKELAIDSLEDVLVVDPSNKEAYGQIAAIYDEEGNYDAIFQMANDTEDDNLLDALEEYVPSEPKVTTAGGSFENEVSIGFIYDSEDTLYYTTDGSNPSNTNGLLYEGGEIVLTTTTEIRAICYDAKQHYSKTIKENYKVSIVEDINPVVEPESGVYTETTMVTITIPEDAKAYYTIDGSEPDAYTGTEYTEPFEMTEGNHVLSVVVFKNHRKSDVVVRSYIYTPLDK